jgi:putative restriction endonuclease
MRDHVRGGQNDRGEQIADQEFKAGNRALAVSADEGLPVRVVRGAGGDPAFSPGTGYRYDGLFYVEKYWHDTGRSGFRIYRYRLVKSPAENPLTNPPPGPPPGGDDEQAFATVQRLVRNTAVTQWVKDLHGHTCQVCGVALKTASGPYAEGAHLRPVGQPHNGPDVVENVLCLCPNDHVRLDRGVIAIDDELYVIEASTGARLGRLRRNARHRLDVKQVAYQCSLFGL